MDPPIIRMQKELNNFFRNLRLEWHFYGQPDGRSELEKKFYPHSDWNPPKACVEIEKFISRIQEKFDRWKSKRFPKDNLSKPEREFLKKAKTNTDIVYMWEDKGPSFVKMNRNQYLEAGKSELEKEKFYEKVENVNSVEIKAENDKLVDEMMYNGEIPDKVAQFLKGGQYDLSRFYHLLKTHKIPTDIEDSHQ